MQHIRVWYGLLAVTFSMMIMVGCGDDSPMQPGADPVPNPYTETDAARILPPEEEDTVLSYDARTGDMAFDADTDYARSLEIGSVLVGKHDETAPYGFLRKVTGISSENGRKIVTTEPALLTDAFETMSIADTLQLRPSQIRSQKLLEGVTIVPDKNDRDFIVAMDVVAYDIDGDHDTTADQIRIVGQYSFMAELQPSIEISLFGRLEQMEFVLEIDQETTLGLVNSVAWEFADESFEIWEMRLARIPLAAAVWITPTLTVEAHMHGDLSITFETSVAYTQENRLGLGYERSSSPQYYSIAESEKEFTYSPPSLTAELDFSAGASLNCSCLIYDVAGPYIGGKTGFDFAAGVGVDPCDLQMYVDLEAIFYVVAGLEMDAVIFDLDWSREFELYTHPVGEWTYPLGGSGTVVIDPEPDSIDALWSLEGPCGFSESGTGDRTLEGLRPGEYSMAWGGIEGYITPSGDTQSLTVDGLIAFVGTYIEDSIGSGTIEIDQIPDVLAGAGWTITGPQSRSGSGDASLTDMPAGEYSIAWDAVQGYLTPPGDSQVLIDDGAISFAGVYLDNPDPAPGFITIPSGTFTMGSPSDELGRYEDEAQHTVTLTTAFKIQSTELTNRQYADLAQWALENGYCTVRSGRLRDGLDGSTEELLDLGSTDCEISFSAGTFSVDTGKENHPVKEVTWYGAAAYCDWLSLKTGLPRAYDHDSWVCNNHNPYEAVGYRLPTEAEWEYACRAGSSTSFANGEISEEECGDPVLDQVGWYCGDGTHPVAELSPNAWGIYDMHGNINEWCNDWYGAYGDDGSDPIGPTSGEGNRVLRGGHIYANARGCRSAVRNSQDPEFSRDYGGFRPVIKTSVSETSY